MPEDTGTMEGQKRQKEIGQKNGDSCEVGGSGVIVEDQKDSVCTYSIILEL